MAQARKYIAESMGANYAENVILDLEKTWEESDCNTPLINFLSMGSDPTSLIENLAKRHKFGMFHSIQNYGTFWESERFTVTLDIVDSACFHAFVSRSAQTNRFQCSVFFFLRLPCDFNGTRTRNPRKEIGWTIHANGRCFAALRADRERSTRCRQWQRRKSPIWLVNQKKTTTSTNTIVCMSSRSIAHSFYLEKLSNDCRE